MNEYEQVFYMMQNHIEKVDEQSVQALKNYQHHEKIADEINELTSLPWFNNFLNNKLTEPITVEQTKTISKFIQLQSQMEYDEKFMYYLHGMQDGSALATVFKQLND